MVEGRRRRQGEMEVRLFGSRERGSREDASWGADPWRGVHYGNGWGSLRVYFWSKPLFLVNREDFTKLAQISF
jgi:hypothetical protein